LTKVVVIGAGLAGLSTALALENQQTKFSVTVLEKEKRAGGLCRTVETKGFFFDYAGHLLHFRGKEFKKFVLRKLRSQLVKSQRQSWIYSHGVYTRYPFQANLFGLPSEVIADCLYGYFQSIFKPPRKRIRNLDDWIKYHFGDGIAKYFMTPYNTKLFRCPPEELSPDCIERFVPIPNYLQVIKGALSGDIEKLGYNATFFYPEKGGIEGLIKAITRQLSCVKLNQEVCLIDLKKKDLLTTSGETFDFDLLVSTAPLPELIKLISDVPHKIHRAAEFLDHVSVLNINLGVEGDLGNKHWIYLPEEVFIPYRIGFPHNFSPKMVPPGCSSISAEISYNDRQRPDVEKSIQRLIDDLMAMKILRSRRSIVTQAVIDIPYAYVAFNHKRRRALQVIQSFLSEKPIFSAGRYGRWDYYSMEDSYLDGLRVAGELSLITKKGKAF